MGAKDKKVSVCLQIRRKKNLIYFAFLILENNKETLHLLLHENVVGVNARRSGGGPLILSINYQ